MLDVPIYNFAKCPEHGLHGLRDRCFVCGAEAELVPMVPLAAYQEVLAELEVERHRDRGGRQPWHVHVFAPDIYNPEHCKVCRYTEKVPHHEKGPKVGQATGQ